MPLVKSREAVAEQSSPIDISKGKRADVVAWDLVKGAGGRQEKEEEAGNTVDWAT